MRRYLVFAIVLALGLAAGTMVLAQTTPADEQASKPALLKPMLTPAVPITYQMQTGVLSADTFVSVKDQGDSQTVLVYKVDDQGKVRLTHKAKFFY